VIESINAYIHDNIGVVRVREIAAQVTDLLNEDAHQLTQEEVEEHIREHVQSPKAVMQQNWDELVALSQLAKDDCACPCAESGKQRVDAKMVASYLKTVDRIMCIVWNV
jgi:hypothetical protein